MSDVHVLEKPPKVFAPLDAPDLRYLGAYGGRGSGKSHNFAGKAVRLCSAQDGTRILCGREVQKSLKESAKKLVEDKIKQFRAPGFRILNNEIQTPGGGLIAFQGLAEHTAESIMSYEGFDVFWIEQAETLSQKSLDILRPTLRKAGSQIWFSWNPRRKSDAVDAFMRGGAPPPRSMMVEANWRDNPYLTRELVEEREYDLEHNKDTYAHKWEGEYATVIKGAYYAEGLGAAAKEGRIGRVAIDPICQVRACWDLGVGDATAIWIVQFVAREIRVLDYIEGEGQPLSYYVSELRKRGWENALCVLPHDGAHRDSVQAIKFEDHLKEAGFKTQTFSNQGAGAARLRIEAARRLFPRMWFNDNPAVNAGRETLGCYHEKWDEDRQIGLGPEHDFSSHAADAFGLMAIAYEQPKSSVAKASPARVGASSSTAWMGS